jgi:hypothetical protein
MQRLAQARMLTVQRVLQIAPPERVYPLGSWAANTMALPNRTVDVALQMPASCFDEKDQLNGRYFARYSAVQCSAVQSSACIHACLVPPGNYQ